MRILLARFRTLIVVFATLCSFLAADGAYAQGTVYLPRPFPSVGAGIGGVGWDCSGESTIKLVDPSGRAYIMTNNHVAGFNNGGGVAFSQPWGCSGHSDCDFGTVYSYLGLQTCYSYNGGDAALIKMSDNTLANNNLLGFTKLISSKVVSAVPSKSAGIIDANTGGLETGPIISTGNLVYIDYTGSGNCFCHSTCPTGSPDGSIPAPRCWAGLTNSIFFGNQVLAGNPSLAPGTSGALIFTTTDNCNNPIAINYASGFYAPTGTYIDIGTPVLTAIQNLGVTINPVNTCVSNGWTALN